MRKIPLGKTGVHVSAVSVGTWSHGGALTVGDEPVGWSGHDDRQALDALRSAWELGLDHWDTADVYGEGHAERLIGRLWGEIDRDRLFLASKVGWHAGERHGHHYHPRQIRERLEASLANLATDHIDLYYLHRCDFGTDDRYLEGAVEALAGARRAGKIRFVGLSDWDSAKIARYAPIVEPDVVQPYRNVVDDTWSSSGLARWVAESGAGVAFFSPLKHGLLLGKYDRPPRFPEGDFRSRIAEFADARRLAHYRRCRAAVEARYPDRAEPILRAVVGALLADAPTACVLLGMRNRTQAEAAAAAGDGLTAEEAAWVRHLYRGGD